MKAQKWSKAGTNKRFNRKNLIETRRDKSSHKRTYNNISNYNSSTSSKKSKVITSLLESSNRYDTIDISMGYKRLSNTETVVGYLFTLGNTNLTNNYNIDDEGGNVRTDIESSNNDSLENVYSGVDLYFINSDGSTFKSTIIYFPYFLIEVKENFIVEIEQWLLKQYNEFGLLKIDIVYRNDLTVKNHLSTNYKKPLLKLSFNTVQNLVLVRDIILKIVKRNKLKENFFENFENFQALNKISENNSLSALDYQENILDIREYDVPYIQRVCIDNNIRCGEWYYVNDSTINDGKGVNIHSAQITNVKDSNSLDNHSKNKTNRINSNIDYSYRPSCRIFAFDIETSKSPLQFPDPNKDPIMMISYVVDSVGYLLVNRAVVVQDITQFDYNPRIDINYSFTVENLENEEKMLRFFVNHIKTIKPTIFVTYNGDFFDWPYIETRCLLYKIYLSNEIGLICTSNNEYLIRSAIHIDCLYWVKRDSYLPQGSHGLKAVAKAKLNYDPLELDPELMTPYATTLSSDNFPQVLAQYSVSDAVATFNLYMTFIHMFIFSLSNIIPLTPDDVLRKGSGTLCELLLMVKAYEHNILAPNKQEVDKIKFYQNHLLENETYVGGHVESIEVGVYRSDLKYSFTLYQNSLIEMKQKIDDVLSFACIVENGVKLENVDKSSYDSVKQQIEKKLQNLIDIFTSENQIRAEYIDIPLIYHLDVGAMYPNIILTNRLQPHAIVNDSVCAACDFNDPVTKKCQRYLNWTWRGTYFPLKKNEFLWLQNQLEMLPVSGMSSTVFSELREDEKQKLLVKAVKEFCQKTYKRIHDSESEERIGIVCQNENAFYVDTVRDFRDRRYKYKGEKKKWGKKKEGANKSQDLQAEEEAKEKVALYDSLQLAHKCILNSFYGYVMRRGSRWHSMEMAGIVTAIGAELIRSAREFVEKIAKPLELDTDGIWCAFPSAFPDNFELRTKDGKIIKVNFPCSVLNNLVHESHSNHQYATLDPEHPAKYKVHSECSILFELDGPYKCMVLPASTQEGKRLKKRYIVFNNDKSIAELKGFEIKRRGELKLIKIFQSSVFSSFLEGNTLQECYDSCAKCAIQWLEILWTRGGGISDEEIIELISESRNMTNAVEEYDIQKSCCITTAKRLGEFLSDAMTKMKGLACRYVISKKPEKEQTSARAIPVTIFSAPLETKKRYLKKWLKDNSLEDFDIRAILDWDYYIERFSNAVQKLICIPAVIQKVFNPIPQISPPDWLRKELQRNDGTQRSIHDFFRVQGPDEKKSKRHLVDIEECHLHKKNDEVATKKKPLPGIPMPESSSEFYPWLRHMMKRWKMLRKELKEHPNTSILSSLYSTELSALANANSSVPWHVLSLLPIEKQPGLFLIWAIVADRLTNFTLRVPRVFYLNIRTPINDIDFALLSSFLQEENDDLILPHKHKVYHLYKLQIDEKLFQENQKDFQSILTHPDIEGIYESQLPLLFSAILHIGSSPRLSKSCDPQNLALHQLTLDDLELSTSSQASSSYLSDKILSNSSVSKIYVYHSYSKERGIIGLFIPGHEATIFVISNTPSEELPKMNLQTYFDKSADTIDGSSSISSAGKSLVQISPEEMNQWVPTSFSLHYVKKMSIALKNMHFLISSLSKTSSSLHQYNQILLLCSPDPSYFVSAFLDKTKFLPIFPIINIPSHPDDHVYPALGWIPTIISRMMMRFREAQPWFKERISYCKYSNIPLGNLPEDYLRFIADVQYARLLRDHQQLLWYSPTSIPDLGGAEIDDHFFDNEFENNTRPEIVRPGFYHHHCISMEVLSLAINSIMEMNALVSDDPLFPSNSSFESNEDSGHNRLRIREIRRDDRSAVDIPLQMLKALVSKWLSDVAFSSIPIADLLLQNCQRWIRLSTSLLHDPLISHFVDNLMKKFFFRLLSLFQNLGAVIVYASFDNLTLATSKQDYSTTLLYVKAVNESVSKNPLFKWIHINLVWIYESLVFYDAANFSGLRYTYIDDNQNTNENEAIELASLWMITSHLPNVVKSIFDKIIEQIVYLPRDFQHQSNKYSSQDPKTALVSSSYSEYLVNRIMKHFMPHILDIISRLNDAQSQVQYPSDDEHENAFAFSYPPCPVGTFNNPALELSKIIVHIFSLYQNAEIQHAIRVLNSNLLRLLGIQEFSYESAFHIPYKTYILSDVICTYCNYSANLDLGRDPRLLESHDQGIFCIMCHHPYNLSEIEFRLINHIHHQSSSYQIQDLVCNHCKDIKSDNLNFTCQECSAGSWKLTIPREKFLDNIKMFLHLGQFYHLDWLIETAQWLQVGVI